MYNKYVKISIFTLTQGSLPSNKSRILSM